MNPFRLFFPVLEDHFETHLTPEAAAEAVAAELQPKQTFKEALLGRVRKPYIGEVQGSTFNIRRAIRYRNSFLPQIRGEILSTDPVTVRVRMGLQPAVILFGTTWLAFAFFFIAVAIFSAVHRRNGWELAAFGCIFPTFFAVMANVAFRIEARRAREFLRVTLGATSVPEESRYTGAIRPR